MNLILIFDAPTILLEKNIFENITMSKDTYLVGCAFTNDNSRTYVYFNEIYFKNSFDEESIPTSFSSNFIFIDLISNGVTITNLIFHNFHIGTKNMIFF